MDIRKLPGRVFINYRRGLNAASAGRVYDRLRQDLPEHQVFMDVDTIKPGEDFRDAIDTAVGSSAVLLVIVGEGWTELRGNDVRRIDEPDDVVRLEIEAALKHKIRIIPVLIDDARMPSEESLPKSIRALASRHSVSLRHARFHDDANTLVGTIFQSVTTKRFRWTAIPALISAFGLSFLFMVIFLTRGSMAAIIDPGIGFLISITVAGIVTYYCLKFDLWLDEKNRQRKLIALASKPRK